jgi:hypothetical protein
MPVVVLRAPDAKGFHLILVRFRPRAAKKFSGQLALEINFSAENSLKVFALGYGSIPRLVLPSDGKVCIKPTCLGVYSSRIYTIR